MINDQQSAAAVLSALFDDGVYTELSAGYQGRSGQSVITAYGYAGGTPVYVFAQDSSVSGGAVDSVHAAKIAQVFELAARNGMPVIGVYDSRGAFVDDGVESLNAYSLMLEKLTAMSGVVPTVSVITGICSGSMALIASSADLVVMTKDAEIYLDAADPSSADKAAENGTVQLVAKDAADALDKVRRYLSLMPQNDLSPLPEYEYDPPAAADMSDAHKACESVADAGSIIELSAAFGKASVTALGTVNGTAAGLVATDKTAGKLTPHDLQKIARFVRLCDAYGIPVVTIVDCEGIENKGCAARMLVRMAAVYSEAVCPKVTIISGKATGAVFTAFAGKNAAADMTIALDTAVIAPIDPMTAAEFLYHDRLIGAADPAAVRKASAEEYARTEGSAALAAQRGAVDMVTDASGVRAAAASALDFAAGKRLLRRLPKKHSVIC